MAAVTGSNARNIQTTAFLINAIAASSRRAICAARVGNNTAVSAFGRIDSLVISS
ncbi:hypothetical protein D3C87_2118810 [compost metagenome]